MTHQGLLQTIMEDLKEIVEFLNSIPDDSLAHDLLIIGTLLAIFIGLTGFIFFLMNKFPELNDSSITVTNNQKETGE